MTSEALREALAEIEHKQWVKWSRTLANSKTDIITSARLERWKKLWRPYSELTEAEKDQDREWADQILHLLATSLPENLHTVASTDLETSKLYDQGWNAYRDEVIKLLGGGDNG